ncbi:hypothetical protein CLCR_07534 [Cladophialophora carrionii]|uniref:Uncharacterized protein n=1 Tax=Cladophialophora carrionii TaxID=86049 RepID=A0A1C1CMH7_9EURO|nr:hypothetical protein CLCR_07534 [Cladophialophora carrionii]
MSKRTPVLQGASESGYKDGRSNTTPQNRQQRDGRDQANLQHQQDQRRSEQGDRPFGQGSRRRGVEQEQYLNTAEAGQQQRRHPAPSDPYTPHGDSLAGSRSQREPAHNIDRRGGISWQERGPSEGQQDAAHNTASIPPRNRPRNMDSYADRSRQQQGFESRDHGSEEKHHGCSDVHSGATSNSSSGGSSVSNNGTGSKNKKPGRLKRAGRAIVGFARAGNWRRKDEDDDTHGSSTGTWRG